MKIEEFRNQIDDSRAFCKICGFRAHSIVDHLKVEHKLSVGQYRDLHPGAPTVSRIVSELLRQLERSPKHTDAFDSFIKPFQAAETDTLITGVKANFWTPDPAHQNMVPEVMTDFRFDDSLLKPILFGLLRQMNIYVEGPTGCGKTEVIYQTHARLGLPMKRVNMNGDVTVANFIGSKQADPTRGTYFEKGNLPKAMEGGYTLLVDEVDYAPPHIAAVLNSVLEGNRVLYLPDIDETVHAKQGFNVIATANTGGKGDMTGVYAGTEILNTAFLDRFPLKLTADYLQPDAEIEMLNVRFNISNQGNLEGLVKAANEVRQSFKAGTLPVTISTRKLIDIFTMEGVLGLKGAVDCAILNWLDTENRNVVTQIMQRSGVNLS